MTSGLLQLAVLLGCVAITEWLTRNTALRHAGTALTVIVVAAVVANVGLLPPGGTQVPLYDVVFSVIAPAGVFLLLLRVQLAAVLRAGPPMLLLFLLGAGGTMLGALAGRALSRPLLADVPLDALTGMFAATYIGGSANFNALALHYGLADNAVLFAGSNAIDSGITAAWMAVTLALPRLLGGRRAAAPAAAVAAQSHAAQERFDPMAIAILIALALATILGSSALAAWLAERGVAVPSILILTTVALILAQIPAVARLSGTEPLALLAVYLFLGTVGALCDLRSVASLGALGLGIVVLAGTIVVVHGVIVFGVARALRMDPVLSGIASQANIGGATTAMAVARSLEREDLVLPAILVGSLGTALGSYAGFAIAAL